MKHTHKIKIANRALGDLKAIARYIYRDSPQNAAMVSDRLLEEIEGLKSMPDRFKFVTYSRKKKFPVHALTVRPFIVYYRVEPEVVFVLNINYGAQRQPRRFE